MAELLLPSLVLNTIFSYLSSSELKSLQEIFPYEHKNYTIRYLMKNDPYQYLLNQQQQMQAVETKYNLAQLTFRYLPVLSQTCMNLMLAGYLGFVFFKLQKLKVN